MKNSKNTILEKVAKLHNITPAAVEAEIQAAIDVAWNDLTKRSAQLLLFPEGKPTPSLFIKRMAEYARQKSAQ